MTDIKTLVSVKALEWTAEDNGDFIAQSIVGWYHVGMPTWCWSLSTPDGSVFSSFHTHTDAQAAAQADYEARVLSSLSPSREAGEAVACKSCNGLGTEADWVGDDMRCVAVACSACGGMGTITPPTSEPEVSTLKAEVERLRKAAQQVIAANNSFRESIAQFNPGDDPLDEAINSLAAALHEVEEG